MEKRETSLRLNQLGKLIPRDISESLGKLPPAATDLEIDILGAIMLERDALAQVPYLKPQHFYLDQHQEIFRAILQLNRDGKPIDMRLVVNQLRESGKLELIGGMLAIAQLTSAVSSAANIDHHARVVVEMSMKRDLIQIASKIHHEAYDDTTDIFKLLESTQQDIKFLEDRETKSSGPERIKKLWETLMLTTKPEDVPPLVMIDGCPVVGPRDHTLIVGKKKSRKSLLVVHLMHLFLKDRQALADQILIFDTEQGKSHVWKTRDRLYRMTNQHVPVFYLRGQSPQFRLDFIRDTIANWHTPPKIVVIDGIRDLMSNINDADESTNVIVWLEKLIAEFDIGVVNILHLNKTDSNPRGHIGTELQNKTIATIECEYDNKTGFSVVKCESARDGQFENFAFTHGPTGLPEMVGVPLKENMAQDDQITRLRAVFEDEALGSKDLIEAMKAQFGIGITGVKKLIADYVRRGWILKSGKDRDPNVRYKLMVADGKYIPPPVVIPNPQQELGYDRNSFIPVPDVDDMPF